MSAVSSMLLTTARKINKKVSGLRHKNPKRLPWKDKKDFIFGRYFFWTIPYGVFYLIGAAVGFGRTGNWFCFGISGGCGLLILILGIAHYIDYYRGVYLEAVYLAIPLVISLFVGIFMACVYGMGATLKIALPVAIIAWISVVFYMYAVAKEHGDGEYQRPNVYVQSKDEMDSISNIKDFHDLAQASEGEREQFRNRLMENLATTFNMPKNSLRSDAELELRRREGQRLLNKDTD